jgi:hypothetical protein
MFRKVIVALALLLSLGARAYAQGADTLRQAVGHLVDSLAGHGGNFENTWAAGDYDGPKAPFHSLQVFFDAEPDSTLMALVDCFTDSESTQVQFRHHPVIRGALCYIFLQNLVYRETGPGEHWPGNFYDHPTLTRLRAAQRAWRQAVRRHWYVAS